MWTAGPGGQTPPVVLLVQGSRYTRFEHAGVLAEVAKLPEHVGRSLATELWILSGQICAPARHVILRWGADWAASKRTDAVLSDAADVTEVRRRRYF